MVKICFNYGHGARDPRAGIFNLEVGETRISDINLGLKERVDFVKRQLSCLNIILVIY